MVLLEITVPKDVKGTAVNVGDDVVAFNFAASPLPRGGVDGEPQHTVSWPRTEIDRKHSKGSLVCPALPAGDERYPCSQVLAVPEYAGGRVTHRFDANAFRHVIEVQVEADGLRATINLRTTKPTGGREPSQTIIYTLANPRPEAKKARLG